MRKIFLIFTVFLSLIGYSQDVDLHDVEYLKYKKSYIELMCSDDYDNYLNLDNEFREKLPKDLVGTEENFAELISSQISKSKFNSVEEALGLQKKFLDIKKKVQPLLDSSYDMQNVLIDKFGKELFWDVYYKDLQKSIREELKNKS